MPLRISFRAALCALALTTASAGLVGLGAGTAQADAPAPIPAHVFTPYFEAYNGDSLSGLATESGNRYLTMAFIQVAKKGSCTPLWNGDTSMPIASSSFGADIAAIQAGGGNVIPSFGGYTADHTGTDIADSCTDVASIAAAYESVVTTYNVTRIDLDIEDKSLTNTAGYTRRNEAVAMTEAWAAANGRTLQFSYTIPSATTGLAASGLKVMKNAVTEDARVDVVNIMTFDYYLGTVQEMATDTESAAAGLYAQLAKLYPTKTAAQLWANIGVTEMVGIDDYGADETFTQADAATVLGWAQSKGISTLSFWALQRDNGGCVGTAGSDTCSGITQPTWFFSNAFEPFTSGNTTPVNNFSVAVAPASAAVNPGSSATATVSTAVTLGSAQSVALTASDVPAGVTATLSPTTVTAGGSATLTVATTAAATPGTYQITVNGTAPSGTNSAVYTLTVNGATTNGLINGGFETGSLSPWVCQSGGAVVTTPVHSGVYAVGAAATASQTGECDQAVTLAPSTKYTLTGWVQGSYAYIGVSGGAAADSWTSSSTWKQLSVSFTTGASGAVTVYVHGWYSEGDVYADDFAIS